MFAAPMSEHFQTSLTEQKLTYITIKMINVCSEAEKLSHSEIYCGGNMNAVLAGKKSAFGATAPAEGLNSELPSSSPVRLRVWGCWEPRQR